MSTDSAEREQALHDRAVKQLKKQRDFRGHVLVYVMVNACLVAIWMVTSGHGFFWPVFPIAFWGIGVIMNAFDVYGRQEITEEDLRQEMEHLRKGRQPGREEAHNVRITGTARSADRRWR